MSVAHSGPRTCCEFDQQPNQGLLQYSIVSHEYCKYALPRARFSHVQLVIMPCWCYAKLEKYFDILTNDA